MNQQNNTNSGNLNNQSNYESLTLQELKNLAAKKEIRPSGNKTSKDTWIQALEDYDSSFKTSNKNSTNEDLSSFNGLEQPEQESLTVSPQEFLSDNPFKQGSQEAQKYVLENIVTALDQRRIDVNRLEINLDGQNIFKMRDGDVAKSTITDGQAELIKQALNDSASFKGSIKITNGSQVLLQVKDGIVLRDSLGLTKSSTKVEINSAAPAKYEKYAQNVESKGLQATKDIAINALTDGVGQNQVKEMIKIKDPGYQNLAASAGEDAASKTLDKIVTSASAVVKNQNSPAKSEQMRKAPAYAPRV